MRKTIFSWINIFIGCTIMAAGFVFFINPYNLVPGGVYGASIVLHNLFPSIQVGTFGYMFDIPLLILSVVLLGSKLGGRTIAAALTTPLIMNVISALSYPSEEALHALDPSQLLGGVFDMTDHLMLTTIIGAAVIGIGQGIVVRNQATTGGTDIVAMILQKYAHIRFSNAILLGGRPRGMLWPGSHRFWRGWSRRCQPAFVAPVLLFAHRHLCLLPCLGAGH